MQMHTNEWFVRHARRVLQERAAAGKLGPEANLGLTRIARESRDVRHKLRALWALNATGGIHTAPAVPDVNEKFPKRLLDLRARPISTQPLLMELLEHPDEHLRWWCVQLLCEDKNPPAAALQRFATMARDDKSSFVRLSLASALQRIPAQARWPVAQGLVAHAEDVADKNLPLMIWYGIESAVPGNKAEAMKLAGTSKIPLVREFIVRRLTQ